MKGYNWALQTPCRNTGFKPLGQAPAEFRHRRKGGRLSRFHPRHGRHETLDTHDTIAAVGKEFWTMENLDET